MTRNTLKSVIKKTLCVFILLSHEATRPKWKWSGGMLIILTQWLLLGAVLACYEDISGSCFSYGKNMDIVNAFISMYQSFYIKWPIGTACILGETESLETMSKLREQ